MVTALTLRQQGVRIDAEGLRQHAIGAETAFEGVGDRARLFEDLLLHEVAIFAALGRVGRNR
jgi:hypothetical protein